MVDYSYHIAALNQRLSPKLKRLWIETTDLCNSRCKTCSIWKNKESKRNLNYNVLSNPLFKHVDYILNSGGEPSLCDLKSILLLEHKLLPQAVLQVSTNGLLPEKVLNAVGAVLAVGAQVDVGISLDGIGEVHDNFRGVPGNFEKVNSLVKGLNKLKPEGCHCPNVTVGSTLTYETAEQADALLHYANVNRVGFMWHWPNKSAFYRNEDSTFNNSVDKPLFTKAICKAFPEGTYRESWLNSLNGINPCFDCYALRSFAVIKCNGDIAPCLTHWNMNVGNIMEKDPKVVWESLKVKKARNNVHSCGLNGCLNSWGYAWSVRDAYFPALKTAIMSRLP